MSSIAPWDVAPLQWQADITTPGHYTFVVVVDPENAIGARDTYRTEFLVD